MRVEYLGTVNLDSGQSPRKEIHQTRWKKEYADTSCDCKWLGAFMACRTAGIPLCECMCLHLHPNADVSPHSFFDPAGVCQMGVCVDETLLPKDAH